MKGIHFLWTLIFFIVHSGSFASVSGDSLRNHYSEQISEDTLRAYLTTIASDEFEGRETGKEGQKKAARFIADKFEEYGLQAVADSGYFQRYHVMETGVENAVIHLQDETLDFLDDFYFFAPMVASGQQNIEEIHFMGYGIDDSLYSDYTGIVNDIESAVIWEEEPVDDSGDFLMTGTGFNTAWSRDFSLKLKAAKEHGVKNLFVVNEDYDTMIKRMSYYLSAPRVSLWEDQPEGPELSVYYISPGTARELLGKRYKPVKLKSKIVRTGKNQSFKNDQKMVIDVEKQQEKVVTENVAGFLKGDSANKEVLVITAHYDHLGIRNGEIYNGADDDGSGTVSLLEMARVFSRAAKNDKAPGRSILFLAVSGEEKGLLGSEYYTENPIVALNNTVANLNIDMIGRNDESHEPNSDYVYIIGSDRLSTSLHNISERTNEECCNLELDYTYNEPNDPNRFYYRSDHYNFVKNGVPAIFYFSGVHEDYHQPTDTVEKIQFEKMSRIVELIFSTAWSIAYSDVEIAVDVYQEQ